MSASLDAHTLDDGSAGPGMAGWPHRRGFPRRQMSPSTAETSNVTPNGIITTVVGGFQSVFARDGGPAALAGPGSPADVILDASGNLILADDLRRRVRKVIYPPVRR